MSNKTGFTLVCYSFKNIIFFFLGKVKQNPFPAKQKRPEHLILQAFQPFPEQGMRESNSRQRFWRPLSYHLTNPLYIKYYEGTALIYYIHLSFVFQYLFLCTFKTSHRSLQTNFLNTFCFRKPVISIPRCSISMILLRKTAPVNSHSSVNKFPHCVRFHAPVFLRFWSSPRPISGSPLHALLRFHSCPIYLILFQGSYFLLGRDISSWGGLHA